MELLQATSIPVSSYITLNQSYLANITQRQKANNIYFIGRVNFKITLPIIPTATLIIIEISLLVTVMLIFNSDLKALGINFFLGH